MYYYAFDRSSESENERDGGNMIKKEKCERGQVKKFGAAIRTLCIGY